MFIVIARLDEESEIDAILAGGVSFERLVAPLVFIGVVLGIVSAGLWGAGRWWERTLSYRVAFTGR